ncbi:MULTISPECIES: 1-phosphofructokinase family hexose kinase [Corynebacterium]|uniref:1-phosphofructokinase family hexose kinase n=1 Tax=Corynebacterium TaxID=1716 RepID=UPI00124BE889|nr:MULTISPECIES: 1-phosphofructokinase family hexose kinase [Corynebacterium]
MIVTFTPNPSLDRTLSLEEPLSPGSVQRLSETIDFAGGKGINVAHACALAGEDTLAVLPARATDPFLMVMQETPIPFEATPSSGTVRTNITITDSAGETTKLNGPGPVLSPLDVDAALSTLIEHAAEADYMVLAGSLPRGVDVDFYCTLARTLHDAVPQLPLAIDTSDDPLRALAPQLESLQLDVLKPNGMELGQIVGVSGARLEASAHAGDYAPVAEAASHLIARGLSTCITTLGAAGAVLTTAEGSWVARSEAITPVSTVGAGDCTLAGYAMARTRGDSPCHALKLAVSYGTAATLKPGTMIPSAADAAAIRVDVDKL